ncbi:hypothetical protein ZWY2020_024902 [Hordeum vulgare]|nr:hypothetical protein ZWY2020_024902 [Hordeum vulgare]
MQRGDDGRRADWRRDDGHSRLVAPEGLPDVPLPAPAPAKKKKKSKKKKAAGSSLGGLGDAANSGALAEALDPPARVNRQRSRKDTMCINCGCVVHYRSECEAPPRCPTTLAYLGYGGGVASAWITEIEEVAARPQRRSPWSPAIYPGWHSDLVDLIRDELMAYIGDLVG